MLNFASTAASAFNYMLHMQADPSVARMCLADRGEAAAPRNKAFNIPPCASESMKDDICEGLWGQISYLLDTQIPRVLLLALAETRWNPSESRIHDLTPAITPALNLSAMSDLCNCPPTRTQPPNNLDVRSSVYFWWLWLLTAFRSVRRLFVGST